MYFNIKNILKNNYNYISKLMLFFILSASACNWRGKNKIKGLQNQILSEFDVNKREREMYNMKITLYFVGPGLYLIEGERDV
jgi:hypothetical protein